MRLAAVSGLTSCNRRTLDLMGSLHGLGHSSRLEVAELIVPLRQNCQRLSPSAVVTVGELDLIRLEIGAVQLSVERCSEIAPQDVAAAGSSGRKDSDCSQSTKLKRVWSIITPIAENLFFFPPSFSAFPEVAARCSLLLNLPDSLLDGLSSTIGCSICGDVCVG